MTKEVKKAPKKKAAAKPKAVDNSPEVTAKAKILKAKSKARQAAQK